MVNSQQYPVIAESADGAYALEDAVSKFHHAYRSSGCCVDCCGSRPRVYSEFQDHDQKDKLGTVPLSAVARYTRSALAHDLHAMSAHDKSHNPNSTSLTRLRNTRAEACGIAILSCRMRLVASRFPLNNT